MTHQARVFVLSRWQIMIKFTLVKAGACIAEIFLMSLMMRRQLVLLLLINKGRARDNWGIIECRSLIIIVVNYEVIFEVAEDATRLHILLWSAWMTPLLTLTLMMHGITVVLKWSGYRDLMREKSDIWGQGSSLIHVIIRADNWCGRKTRLQRQVLQGVWLSFVYRHLSMTHSGHSVLILKRRITMQVERRW